MACLPARRACSVCACQWLACFLCKGQCGITMRAFKLAGQVLLVWANLRLIEQSKPLG